MSETRDHLNHPFRVTVNPMEVLQARIDSFKKARRVKNPNKPSSTTTVRWPHPPNFKANPETLADAGFFYDPSYDGPDSVTCYVCEKELEGWEADDDPYAIHFKKCGQTCCWAIVRCGLLNDMDKSGRFVFTDKTRLPAHKSMEKARSDTFVVGKGWIHDQVKNHSANSKMMARAGFVYTPQQSNDDLVTCLYCDTSLSGWEANDDPMEEHRKRGNKSDPSCPFFSASISEPATTNRTRSRTQSTKPPSRSQSKPPTRSTSQSKHQDILLPTKTHDGDLDNNSDSSQSTTAAKAIAKTPRKGRSTSGTRKSSAKTPKSKTRSSSKSSLKEVTEVEEENEEAPPATVKKKTRSRSRSVAKSEPQQTNAEEIQKETLRSRSKAQAEDNEDVPKRHSKVKTSKEDEVPPKSAVELGSIWVKSKPNSQPVVKQKMKVVEISSDEEPELEGETESEKSAQSSSRNPKISLTVEVIKPELPSVPTVSPIRDVEVGDTEPKTVYPVPSTPLPQTPPKKDITHPPRAVYPVPSTPLPQTPPKKDIAHPPKAVPASTAVKPPLIPTLSKLPFTPWNALTEAELDMTVEEWIRYQMDVEYDKFRRDGERELQRFRSQAEEVRKVIEGL